VKNVESVAPLLTPKIYTRVRLQSLDFGAAGEAIFFAKYFVCD
jgi:hypothetical protein